MSLLRYASAAQIALLESNQFIVAHLYTITLRDGTAYRYTDCGLDLLVNGYRYLATDLIIERGNLVRKVGMQVDNLSVEIWSRAGKIRGAWQTATLYNPDDIVTYGGVQYICEADHYSTTFAADLSNGDWGVSANLMLGMPFLQLAHNGGLDGARLKLEQLYMATFGDTSAGVFTPFEGRLTVDELSRFSARITVHHDSELLNQPLPGGVFQPGCWNALYDVNCGVNKASKAVSGTITSGSGVSSLNCTLSQAADYFTLGTIEFDTGPNAVVVRSVRGYTTGVVTLSLPLTAMPQVGDTFKAYPGCDGRLDTCTSKFNNRAKFRGQPFVPVPETAI